MSGQIQQERQPVSGWGLVLLAVLLFGAALVMTLVMLAWKVIVFAWS